MKHAVLNNEPNYNKLKKATPAVKKFIKACLRKEASARPSIEELLDFEWLKTNEQATNLSQDVQLDINANLMAFTKTTTFQSGVCSIIANLQTKAEDLSEVREMFLKLDTDSNGFLTLEELGAGMQDICQIFHLDEPDVR